ncbi:MAG: hypothetical protein JJW01_02130, partial [Alphaproteobacteria bacterium]|nr:hypothetical protein [Rickettsiales bacterium]
MLLEDCKCFKKALHVCCKIIQTSKNTGVILFLLALFINQSPSLSLQKETQNNGSQFDKKKQGETYLTKQRGERAKRTSIQLEEKLNRRIEKKKYGNSFPNKRSDYRQMRTGTPVNSLYTVSNRPSEYIYTDPKKLKMVDFYAKSQKAIVEKNQLMSKVLSQHKFSRGDTEVLLTIGAHTNAIYNNTMRDEIVNGQTLLKEFASVNFGPTVGFGLFKKLNDKYSLELRTDYSLLMLNKSFISLTNSTEDNTNTGHRLNAVVLTGVNIRRFGNRNQNLLTYLFGVDMSYNDTSAINNQHVSFPAGAYGDIYGTLASSFFMNFTTNFVSGVRIGLMYNNDKRFIMDTLIGFGSAILFDTRDSAISPLSARNSGASVVFMLNLAYQKKLGNSNFWLTMEMKNRLQTIIMPTELKSLDPLDKGVIAPIGIFAQTELHIGCVA